MTIATKPAFALEDIKLLPLREKRLRDLVHGVLSAVAPNKDFHDPAKAPFDRSSMVQRLRQHIKKLECELQVGVGTGVPVNSSSYATVFSTSPLSARVDLPPGLAALPQLQLHDHRQDSPLLPVPIEYDLCDSGNDGPLLTFFKGIPRILMANPSGLRHLLHHPLSIASGR